MKKMKIIIGFVGAMVLAAPTNPMMIFFFPHE